MRVTRFEASFIAELRSWFFLALNHIPVITHKFVNMLNLSLLNSEPDYRIFDTTRISE